MRKPVGFTSQPVPIGVLFVQYRERGRWVVLGGEPYVKVDNCHRDGRPHLHSGGWERGERRFLREDLRAEEAAEAIARHLVERRYIDVDRLGEELS